MIHSSYVIIIATITGHSISTWPSLGPSFEDMSEWKASWQITLVAHSDIKGSATLLTPEPSVSLLLCAPDTDYYKMIVLFPLCESDPFKEKAWEDTASSQLHLFPKKSKVTLALFLICVFWLWSRKQMGCSLLPSH